jgi:hypothetical protein
MSSSVSVLIAFPFPHRTSHRCFSSSAARVRISALTLYRTLDAISGMPPVASSLVRTHDDAATLLFAERFRAEPRVLSELDAVWASIQATKAKDDERCGQEKCAEDKAEVGIAESSRQQTNSTVHVGRDFVPQRLEGHCRFSATINR